MKLILTESDIHKIIKQCVKQCLSEGQETNNIKHARKYLESKGYSPEQRQQILDSIRTDIPNTRLNKCKFILGVVRLFIDRQLKTGTDIMNLNMALKYINSPEHVNEYNHNLNNESLETLHNRFKSFAEQDKEQSMAASNARQLTPNNQYTIVPIDTPEQAAKYSKYTTWCITQNPDMYKSYTNDGSGKFYFCLRNGFENEPKVKGEGCPLDSYGLSMIAVSVTMEGEVNTITCRWNHDNGANDTVMTIEQLEDVIGRYFYQTFKPYSKEELKAKGMYISDVIGTLYDANGIRGIVAAVDENENPIIILPLEWSEKKMTWDEAMKYGKQLPSPWHIPSKKEMERIWLIKDYPNPITKRINSGIQKYGGKKLANSFSCFWSSSVCSSYDAFYLSASSGYVGYCSKADKLFVFPVVSFGF